jgi:hypothetical protein
MKTKKLTGYNSNWTDVVDVIEEIVPLVIITY